MGDSGDLGHSLDHFPHFLSKEPRQVLLCGFSIFKGVVKEACADSVCIHVVADEYFRHSNRVDKIGLAAFPSLVSMLLGCIYCSG